MTPRERSGDFSQVAHQVVQEATAEKDEREDASEANDAENPDTDRAPSRKAADG
jgi:hypothetical protein